VVVPRAADADADCSGEPPGAAGEDDVAAESPAVLEEEVASVFTRPR